jgi:hypothetical protein
MTSKTKTAQPRNESDPTQGTRGTGFARPLGAPPSGGRRRRRFGGRPYFGNAKTVSDPPSSVYCASSL